MVFNTERFAKRVREKRGTRSLRDVAAELQLGFATLSRIERGKMPDPTISVCFVSGWEIIRQCTLRSTRRAMMPCPFSYAPPRP